MRRSGFVTALVLACLLIGSAAAQSAPVSILVDLDPASASGLRTEGLVADSSGRLYTIETESRRMFRVTPATGAVEVLATLNRAGTGMAFDASGNLYIASTDRVLRVPAAQLAGSAVDPASVTTYASNVQGANGLAFDGSGNLYISGGNTGNIYIVPPGGSPTVFASGFTSDREAQRISTNGLAFGPDGRLYSANTGSGAIDRITLKPEGGVATVERFVTNPLLLGADGITFAANGDLYVAANERNAIVKVTQAGQVSEVASNGNAGPLEFPASPAFSGNALYASNFDVERGANSPAAPGIGASIARIDVGVGGATLPVTNPAPVAPTPAPTPAPSAPAPSAPASSVPAAPSTPVVPEPAPSQAPGVPASLPNTGAQASWILIAVASFVLLVAGFSLRRGARRA